MLFQNTIRHVARALILPVAWLSLAVPIAHAQAGAPSGPFTNSGFGLADQLATITGDARYTRNNVGAVVASIPANQVSNELYTNLGAKPIVYGRYHPETATGRIDVVTMRKTPDGNIEIQSKVFAPKDGSRWAVTTRGSQRAYYHGLNPFAAFYAAPACETVHYAGTVADNLSSNWYLAANANPVCDNFSNLTPAAFFAAVGLAMQNSMTDRGYIAVAETNNDIKQTDDGDLFVSKVTTTLTSSVTPHWYIGTATGRGGLATIAGMYCAVAGSPCPSLDYVVQGGVNFLDWNSGNLDKSPYVAYTHSDTQSGLSFFSFILIAAALAWAGGFALTGSAGFSGGAAAASVGTAGTGLGAAAFAGIAAGTYAGISVLANSATGGLSQAQHGFLGNIGNGQITPTVSGSAWDAAPAVQTSFTGTAISATPGGTGITYGTQKYAPSDYSASTKAGALELRNNAAAGVTPVQLTPF